MSIGSIFIDRFEGFFEGILGVSIYSYLTRCVCECSSGRAGMLKFRSDGKGFNQEEMGTGKWDSLMYEQKKVVMGLLNQLNQNKDEDA